MLTIRTLPIRRVPLLGTPLLLAAASAGAASAGATSAIESRAQTTPADLPVVRLDGVVPDPMAIPVLLIKEEGLDIENGFVFEYSEGDAAGGTTPFLRGDVELGPGDAVSAAIANLEGFDTVAYYPFMSQTAAIVASAESGITAPEDLVGRRVGHFGNDSGTTQAITLTLAQGWDIDVQEDLELVEAPPEVLPELLAQGEVDAIFDFEPFGDRAVQLTDGVRVLDVAKYWQEAQEWSPPLAMLWSSREWLREHPELAAGVVAAFTEAQRILIDSEYQLFKEEPYASFLGLADEAELDRLIAYCVDLPCYTNEWTEADAQAMNDWIQLMVDAGMLDEFPEAAPAATLEQVLAGG